MGFVVTTAAKKLSKLEKKIKVIPGGTSAGKTYNILPILFSKAAITPNLSISVVSETMPHLKRGAMRDFLNVIKDTDRYHRPFWNKTDSLYTLPNDSFMEFFSADDEQRVRGPRRDILYINEANSLKFDTFYQMLIRTRKEIWLDFNPTTEFWAHEELLDHPDAEWLTLTYQDNEALDASIVREIELNRGKAYYNPNLPIPQLFDKTNIKNAYWHNWWMVYGLGLTGQVQESIYTNWKQIDQVPAEALYVGTGLDFGFSNDPTAIIDMYLYNGLKLFDEVVVATGLGISETAEILKRDRKRMVIADRSAPLLIEEIKKKGVNIKAYDATDGKGTKNFGISIMQQDPFLVTKGSLNMIKELRAYVWEKDKAGKLTGRPVDANDHTMDAMRYIGSTQKKKRKFKKGLVPNYG